MVQDLKELLLTRSPAPAITDAAKCKTEDIWRYLDNPTPTGRFRMAAESYSDRIARPCTLGQPSACWSASKDRWCSMGTALSQDLKSESLFYEQSAYSWWSTESAKAISAAHECPHHWYRVNTIKPYAQEMLDLTIKFAECIGEGMAKAPSATTTTSSVSTSSNGSAATATVGATAVSASTATGTGPQATKMNNASGRIGIGSASKFKELGMWIILGGGVVVGVINEVW
jgi:hypothetical protein